MVKRLGACKSLSESLSDRLGRSRWLQALVLVSCLLSGCAGNDPEAALRDTLGEVQAAIEARDSAALQQFLADDFIGNDGLDKQGARRTAAALMMRHRDVGATMGPLDVRMSDGHATVGFTLLLRGGSGMPLPESANLYTVETGWRQEGNDWVMSSARWRPAM